MEISELKVKLKTMREYYFVELGKLESKKAELSSETIKANELASANDQLREELVVISKVALRQLKLASEQLESVASYGVTRVLGSAYKAIELRNDTTNPKSPKTNIYLHKEWIDGEVYPANPYEDNGGGVNDMTAYLLWLGTITGMGAEVGGALLIDEFAKHVSVDLIDNLAGLMGDLQRDLGRQILFVTHNEGLRQSFDTVIEI